MNDLISRAAAIEVMCELMRHWFGGDPKDEIREIKRELGKLPSAQPERMHGHWLRTGRMNIYGGFEVECSVCHDSVMITNIEYEHYCRNCGARMDEEVSE